MRGLTKDRLCINAATTIGRSEKQRITEAFRPAEIELRQQNEVGAESRKSLDEARKALARCIEHAVVACCWIIEAIA
jgi:hypothetical protein